ncbi:hypothetical protein HK099_002227 [Clydaea vesicula]|uniref:Uncharacterized protein n=1 Tax=Clydaea vesicula TaxID=447962 RepID=A0AAD5XWT7_9FUNG|nr:hypothetical protein HK099_002227 [Clydaea vesicula]
MLATLNKKKRGGKIFYSPRRRRQYATEILELQAEFLKKGNKNESQKKSRIKLPTEVLHLIFSAPVFNSTFALARFIIVITKNKALASFVQILDFSPSHPFRNMNLNYIKEKTVSPVYNPIRNTVSIRLHEPQCANMFSDFSLPNSRNLNVLQLQNIITENRNPVIGNNDIDSNSENFASSLDSSVSSANAGSTYRERFRSLQNHQNQNRRTFSHLETTPTSDLIIYSSFLMKLGQCCRNLKILNLANCSSIKDDRFIPELNEYASSLEYELQCDFSSTLISSVDAMQSLIKHCEYLIFLDFSNCNWVTDDLVSKICKSDLRYLKAISLKDCKLLSSKFDNLFFEKDNDSLLFQLI